MFSNYFIEQTKDLKESLAKNIKKKKATAPGVQKDLSLFSKLYSFLQGHLKDDFEVSTQKVRNHRQMIKKNCDIVIYKKWCEQYLNMTGGYVLTDNIYAAMSIDTNYTEQILRSHIALTQALKSLYLTQHQEAAQKIIPLYSILFVYHSSTSLVAIKQQIENNSQRKEIPLNQQLDLLCVLGKGLLIKNWEDEGSYIGLETGKDTLMWFYIILMEYLDRDEQTQINLRNYIKSTKTYNEC